MNERHLSSEGDIYLDPSGHVARISQFNLSVLQSVKTLLGTFTGECFVNRRVGVPWYDHILGSNIHYANYINQILKEKILSVSGVSEVVSVSMKFSGRNLSGTYKIRTSDGSVLTGKI